MDHDVCGSFDRSDRNITGKYAESLAISAFIAARHEIAMPFGNQARWDLLVKVDGVWLEVQIKSARIVQRHVMFDRQRLSGKRARLEHKSRKPERDCDLTVAVLPETGTIWKISAVDIVAMPVVVTLSEKHLWIRGSITSDLIDRPVALNPAEMAPAIVVQPRKVDRRNGIFLPGERPEAISLLAWDSLQKYMAGHSINAIARQYGAHPSSVSERIERAVKHLPVPYAAPESLSA